MSTNRPTQFNTIEFIGDSLIYAKNHTNVIILNDDNIQLCHLTGSVYLYIVSSLSEPWGWLVGWRSPLISGSSNHNKYHFSTTADDYDDAQWPHRSGSPRIFHISQLTAIDTGGLVGGSTVPCSIRPPSSPPVLIYSGVQLEVDPVRRLAIVIT